MNKEEFINNCKKNLNIEINNEKYLLLEKYYNILIEWNNKFNLTSIIDKKEVFLLHFYDSLCLIQTIDIEKTINICDFGTGAGFPGMVIALFFDKFNVTLIESNEKKCIFLKYVVEQLALKNVIIINDRMENYSLINREKFDVITCRAVTSLPIILEISISALKVNGLLLPLKSNIEEDLKNIKDCCNYLKTKLLKVFEYNLPITNAKRCIPIFIKNNETDLRYPQSYSKILKKYKKS